MELHKKIQRDVMAAMKQKDGLRLPVLRSIVASINNKLIEEKRDKEEVLTDSEVISILQKEAKKRREAAEQFGKGNRPELKEREEKELAVIEEYLPAMASKDDIRTVVGRLKAQHNIDDPAKKGFLIGEAMKQLEGQADGNDVREVVESLFSDIEA